MIHIDPEGNEVSGWQHVHYMSKQVMQVPEGSDLPLDKWPVLVSIMTDDDPTHEFQMLASSLMNAAVLEHGEVALGFSLVTVHLN